MGFPHFSRSIFTVIGLGNLIFASSLASEDWTWHTRPDKWKESRNFQTPFLEKYQQRILIHHSPASLHPKVKVFSFNKAYWFGIDPDWETRPR